MHCANSATYFLLVLLMPNLIAAQSLVIIGGALSKDNAPVWESIVELAGGKGVANIAVFTTASEDPTAGPYYTDLFRFYGANATDILVNINNGNADDPFYADHVRTFNGIFFGGGDQLRITDTLRPGGRDTFVMQAIRDVFRAGGVVSGTSAGAACLGLSVMITGGDSYDALINGAQPNTPSGPYDLSYEPNGGLGFLNGYVIDTHFSQRGREGRLIRLLQDTRNLPVLGTTKGFGLDEDTALLVTDIGNRPKGRVAGVGGVWFTDVAGLVSHPSTTTDYEQVSTTYLTLDDVIDMTTGAITFASWKSPLAGNELYENPLPSMDILSYDTSGEWRSAATIFVNSRNEFPNENYSIEQDPQFKITFHRASAVGFAGFHPTDSSVQVVSYYNLIVDLKSV